MNYYLLADIYKQQPFHVLPNVYIAICLDLYFFSYLQVNSRHQLVLYFRSKCALRVEFFVAFFLCVR